MMSRALLEHQGSLENSGLALGTYLAESKYADYCMDPENPIESDGTRAALGMLLENYNDYVGSMTETTRAQHVGDFQKYAFPLIRAIFPELAANNLVSVQPMLGPTSLIFYLDFTRGNAKGNLNKGDTIFSSVARGPEDEAYSSPQVLGEQIATGDGADGIPGSSPWQLTYFPVTPGTLSITDGTQVITDDGNGNLTGDQKTTTAGTINYSTGAITNMEFANIVAAGVAVTADYHYDMEANQADMIPQVDTVIQNVPVIARPRRLRATYSLEAGFNLRALHGLEIQVELVAAVGASIRHEIDREIIRDLQKTASAGSVFWNKDIPDGTGYTEAKLTIVDALIAGNNAIHRATGRATATWVLCGQNVASVIESLPGFVPNPGVPSGLMKGVVRTGNLRGQWDIYKDPFYDVNSFIMGFKGSSFLEAGYVYAPYIPLYTTPLVVLDDFIARQGIGTHYGKKSVNPLFYVTGEIGGGVALAAKAGTSTVLTSANKAIITHGLATDLAGVTNGKGVFGV